MTTGGLELAQLTALERVALIALHKLIIRADGQLSAHETAAFKQLAREMGDQAFLAALAEARASCPGEADTRQLVTRIERVEARRLIFGRLLAVAQSNRISASEADQLRWLARSWALSIDPLTLELCDD